MRRKWARVLAAALAVAMTIPTNLPSNVKAAEATVKNDSTNKGISIEDLYSLGEGYYTDLDTSSKTIKPGTTVSYTANVYKYDSVDEEYDLVTENVTWQWSVSESGTEDAGISKFVNIGTNSADLTYTVLGKNFINSGMSSTATIRVGFTIGEGEDAFSTSTQVYLYKKSPYTLKDNLVEQVQYVQVGQTATLHADAVPEVGYTVSYQWQQRNAATYEYTDIPGATGATYTTGVFNTDTDFVNNGNYKCVITIKDANGAEADKATLTYYVYKETGLKLYNVSETYVKSPGSVINMKVEGLSYDAAKYQVKYEWQQYNESEGTWVNLPILPLGATAFTDSYQVVLDANEKQGEYRCYVSMYPVGTDMNVAANQVASISKKFSIYVYTGLWAYGTKENIKAALNTPVTLTANASHHANTPALNPITYTWYRGEEQIAGQTGASYTINALTAADFGRYTVKVSDGVETVYVDYYIQEDRGWKVNTPTDNFVRKNIGETADLAVAIESAAAYPVTYKWYKGEDIIEGQTAATYSVNVANESVYGTYYCKATNGYDEVTIQFSIRQNDNFYVEALTPTDVYKKVGDAQTFQVRPHSDDATATYTYQWYFNYGSSYASTNYDEKLLGQTTDSLALTNLNLSSFGTYACEVINQKTGDAQTVSFRLRMYSKVNGTYGSDSVFRKDEGEAVSMVANFSNPDNLALEYAWYFLPQNGYEYQHIGAADNTTTLNIAALAEGQYGSYYCEAIYNGNIVLDELTFLILEPKENNLTVEAATDTYVKKAIGESVTMGVTAATKAGRTITYQWYYGDQAIIGATAATYTINPIRKVDFGEYYCHVKDSEGESKNVWFELSRKSAAQFYSVGESSNSIQSIAATYNKAYTLDATSIDDPQYPTTYQWYFNAEESSTAAADLIYEGTAATYAVAAVTKDTVGYYTCKVSNTVETYTVRYYLYFNTNLKLTAKETDYKADLGASVTMKASASCKKGFNITYQWYQYKEYEYSDGDDDYYTDDDYVAIPGATTAEYTIAAVDKNSYGDYLLVASTEGEKCGVYFTLSKPSVVEIEKVTTSTDATFAGSEVKLTGKVTAPKDATLEYQWYVSDMKTDDWVKAKTVKGKDAKAASVTVKAPAIASPYTDSASSYQYAYYKLVVKTEINGKTSSDSYQESVMVVNPSYSNKAPKSKHNYKAGEVSVYGYKAAGNIGTIKATFNKKTFIDKNGDYLYVIDGNGKSSKYYGAELQKKTLTLDGNKFAVVLVSNNEDAKAYGFEVSKVKTSTKKATPNKLTLGAKEKHKITGVLTKKQAKKAKYSTSKKKVATVSKKGVIQAKKPGTAKITIKVGKKKVKTITVTVKKAPKKLKVAKKKVTIKRGKSASVKYSLNPANAASYSTSIKNAKALKKAKVSAYVADGKVTISVAKKAKKKTYKVQVSTYNKKKATIKVKVK